MYPSAANARKSTTAQVRNTTDSTAWRSGRDELAGEFDDVTTGRTVVIGTTDLTGIACLRERLFHYCWKETT